ncbi:MAG: HD domain-containing protein [Chloroflexi bacterium]|nr:HD domain-containing protein [Chloroflexota bacterium]
MWHRARQFFEAGKQPAEADIQLARERLAPDLLQIFLGQHPRDVVHSAGTARWLLERGHDDPDLIRAALLHDVAKGHQRRADRVAYVLAAAINTERGLAAEGSRFEVRRAAARSLVHSEAGALLLRDLGAPPRVVDLTLRHHAPPRGDAMLVLLQEADSAN